LARPDRLSPADTNPALAFTFRKWLALVFAAICGVSFSGCGGLWPLSLRYGASDEGQKPLTAALVQASFYKIESTGFERELLERFARDHQYQIHFKLFNNSQAAIDAVRSGAADLLAGPVDSEDLVALKMTPGPSFEEAPAVLVCPRASKEESPHSLWQRLFGTSKKIPESVHSLILRPGHEQIIRKNYPGIDLKSMKNGKAFEALAAVEKNHESCAILETHEAQFYLRLFPNLQMIQELNLTVTSRFSIRQDRTELAQDLANWYSRTVYNHEVENLKDLYFGHFPSLTNHDHLDLAKNIQDKLPLLLPYFKKSAKEFKLPWQLVAAVAYQESHWDVSAESFTGVKGIMMLTKETADLLGVQDRTDLTQSLWGGAKYLRYLLNQQPRFLSARERLVLALASYNVGFAHVQDAQALSARLGHNPFVWQDLKHVLPLLSFPEYFDQLEHGEARGQEPVEFTNRVLGFYEILGSI
jgi:membrane-bound lytic murein transglycosylase F